MSPIQLIRERYLTQTITLLQTCSSYYRPHILASNYQEMPFITRSDVEANYTAFLFHTSGKLRYNITSGSNHSPLLLVRSSEEVRTTSEYLRSFMNQDRGSRSDRDDQEFVLHVSQGLHGVPFGVDHDNFMTMPCVKSDHVQLIRKLMQDGVPVSASDTSRVGTIVGSTNVILHLLAEAQVARGRETEIRVVTSNSLLTSTSRSMLLNFGFKSVRAEYGLAEFTEGNAFECPSCGGFHFPASVYIDFIPIGNQGLYELVLSSLYPFSQAQLFLKYRTGDLVRVSHDCQYYPDISVYILGRINNELRTDDGSQVPILVIADAIERCFGHLRSGWSAEPKSGSSAPNKYSGNVPFTAHVENDVLIITLEQKLNSEELSALRTSIIDGFANQGLKPNINEINVGYTPQITDRIKY